MPTAASLTRRGLLAASLALPFAAPFAGRAAAHASSSGISWPEDQALPHFARPRNLDVVDLLSGVPADELVLFTTLQGVVNRERPRLYLLQTKEEGVYTWLNDLDLPWHQRDRWTALERYASEVKGLVIWDPDVPASINVATTLAGIHDAVAVSPRLAEKLSHPPYHRLRPVEDLRGRFANDLAAYTWQHDHLRAKTSDRMVVALDPVNNAGFFRDYAVANKAMVVWLEVNVDDERALLERILDEVDPYTPYMGWFPSDVSGEFNGTELVSAHGCYVVGADYFANATVFGGATAPVTAPSAPAPPALRNSVYVTFTMTEGDNVQYNQHRMRVLWDDPGRGDVPINWTTNPLLVDCAPAMLAHYQQTATPRDCLAAGPSGAGYVYPTAWPMSTFPSFTTMTGRYMDATGMHAIQILNRHEGEDVPLGQDHARQLATDVRPRGWFIHHTDHTDMRVVEGVPQATSYLVGSVEEARQAIEESAAGWDGGSPLFVAIAPLAWNLTPSDLRTVTDGLGSDYTVVRGDTFFDLAREANGLPPFRG